jgi:molecular chaperone HtpG
MKKSTDNASSAANPAASKQTLGFQTEVKQLLHLMIHSLYSNREIFMRELISNASDACDKLRFLALDNDQLYEADTELHIDVSFDKTANTLTISDNGIGMDRDEAIANLGTIARSGTKEFVTQVSGDKAKDSNLIGQFGVGFYSAFIVADKVTVRTRKAGLRPEQAVEWESDGSGEFTVVHYVKAGRGTEITLHMRPIGEGETDLLSGHDLRRIVRQYSDHIGLPIRMNKERWDAEKSAYVTEPELETVNQASALWTRNKSDITAEQYNEFYKAISHDFSDPLSYTHNRVEGRTEYTQLLYLPAKPPFDLYDRQNKHGLKLYVKRVFIMEDAEQLLPSYLRFVRGVIDSSDLPLNVSREILQESRDVKAIREGSTKRVLSMLEELANNQPEKYTAFWGQFGAVLKEGLGEDFSNKDRIAKLLRFASTNSADDMQSVSLDQYLGRAKEGQDKIYYVTADSTKAARNSPHLEVFKAKGIEVLLLTDRVDEWMLSYLHDFADKELVSVAKGTVDLGDLANEAESQKLDEATKDNQELLNQMKEALKAKASDVTLTSRLVESPSCLVAKEGDISGHLQRLLKQAGQKAPDALPVLEINPEHAFVKRLKAQSSESNDQFDIWCHLLFDQALLAEGGHLDDPASYVRNVNRLLLG